MEISLFNSCATRSSLCCHWRVLSSLCKVMQNCNIGHLSLHDFASNNSRQLDLHNKSLFRLLPFTFLSETSHSHEKKKISVGKKNFHWSRILLIIELPMCYSRFDVSFVIILYLIETVPASWRFSFLSMKEFLRRLLWLNSTG